MQAVGSSAPYEAGLTPGKTYYWRVDEVNDAEPDSPWKGDVWSFRVRPLTAFDPSPANGTLYVDPNQDLTWDHGQGSIIHNVYFGKSFEEVSNATTAVWMTVNPFYDPKTLEIGQTYYWRVDEFTGPTTHKGEVWSFTILPQVAVTDPDLVGWWKLDEGMGTSVVDWSGRGQSRPNRRQGPVDPRRPGRRPEPFRRRQRGDPRPARDDRHGDDDRLGQERRQPGRLGRGPLQPGSRRRRGHGFRPGQ